MNKENCVLKLVDEIINFNVTYYSLFRNDNNKYYNNLTATVCNVRPVPFSL